MRTDSFAPPGAPLSVRLGPNPGGRDLVVGDLHGHFDTLRRALDELEVGGDDRLFSLGDLIDRGPRSFEAKAWIEGAGFRLAPRADLDRKCPRDRHRRPYRPARLRPPDRLARIDGKEIETFCFDR